MKKDVAVVKDHPFPLQYGPELLVVSRGKGVWLWDTNGNRYLDFAGGIAVNALGYGRADLARIACRQMKRLAHISNVFATEPSIALARTMLAMQPGRFSKVFFGNSGTEANEAALKYARLHSFRTRGAGHDRLLCFANAFHGRTLGALSCTPSAKYQEPYQPLIPHVTVLPYNDGQALRSALDDGVAGVIVEVIQGEGGLTAMTPEFARALNEGCRQCGAILIADEVQTGLGRTGSFFASDAIGLSPDIITLAKPLGGGLPLSAVLIPQKVADLIHMGDHGTTFGGGPVTTAVALRVWETIAKPEFLAAVKSRGEHLRASLERMKARHSCVGALRGGGLLQGFEYTGGAPADLLARLRAAGLLALRAGENVIRLAPPLVIKDKELDKGIDIIEEVL